MGAPCASSPTNASSGTLLGGHVRVGVGRCARQWLPCELSGGRVRPRARGTRVHRESTAREQPLARRGASGASGRARAALRLAGAQRARRRRTPGIRVTLRRRGLTFATGRAVPGLTALAGLGSTHGRDMTGEADGLRAVGAQNPRHAAERQRHPLAVARGVTAARKRPCGGCGTPTDRITFDPATLLPQAPRCDACAEADWNVRVALAPGASDVNGRIEPRAAGNETRQP